jgi:biofilm PGA synthesis N-glycosyltransferase PgaC
LTSTINTTVTTRWRLPTAFCWQDEDSQRAGLELLFSMAKPEDADAHSSVAGKILKYPGRLIVVMPAHNEAGCIARTLTSLRRQTRAPSDVIVVCDNCTDDTAQISARHGAKVIETVGNAAKKAGALNQALEVILPGLDGHDLLLFMDADSQLCDTWIHCAEEAMNRNQGIGGVCGTYLGDNDPGLLQQLQRNEFVRCSRQVRRRAELWVLSGTGTLFRASVLRDIAQHRGERIPGRRGDYYNSSSITEDYEITLALKTLGYRCLAPPGCTAITEVMPTWRLFYGQRLRWQQGTLSDLRRYGLRRTTWRSWLRQAYSYSQYCTQLACLGIIGYILCAGSGAHMPIWAIGAAGISYSARLLSVRRSGIRGVAVAALFFPELFYYMVTCLCFLESLKDEMTGRAISWSHVAKQDSVASPC